MSVACFFFFFLTKIRYRNIQEQLKYHSFSKHLAQYIGLLVKTENVDCVESIEKKKFFLKLKISVDL